MTSLSIQSQRIIRHWAQVAGCYRIVKDPTLTVTLYVGEGGKLYRVSYHGYFRCAWVQMIKVIRLSNDWRDWSNHQK